MGTTDLSQQAMPQLPSFAKLAINPHAASSPSSVHSNNSNASPISPITLETNYSSRVQQRSSMPAAQSYMLNQNEGKDQGSPSSVQRTQNRMSEPPPPRLSTTSKYGSPTKQVKKKSQTDL
jgi:hypothetical protein